MVDPFSDRFESTDAEAFGQPEPPNDYCIYINDKLTGRVIRICDSELPF